MSPASFSGKFNNGQLPGRGEYICRRKEDGIPLVKPFRLMVGPLQIVNPSGQTIEQSASWMG
jgi:hypothetical protein